MTTSKTGETGETNNINKIERGFGGYIGGFAGPPLNGADGARQPVDNSQPNACAVTSKLPKEVTSQLPKRWSDDPWCNMTTGEAEAWRAGWEAAKAQAVTVARRSPIPEEASPAEAHGRLSGALISAEAIASMEPPK